MLFALKNDDGIEIHLDLKEREILYKALDCYASMGKPKDFIDDNLSKISEMQDVLFLQEFIQVR